MKFQYSALLALGIGTVAAIGVHACSQPNDREPAREVYAALVSKGTVDTFFNRLATNDAHLVVTASPVAQASAAAGPILVEPGEQLFVVEAAPAEPLAGEVARLGTFALIKIPVGLDPHAERALGRHDIYAEPLARQLTTTPSEVSPQASAILSELRAGIELRGGATDTESTTIEIDRAFLEQKLKELSGAVPVDVDGRRVTISERRSTAGKDNTRAWLRQQYAALGFTTSEHTYSSGLSRGVNFIAEKTGADPTRYVLVTAHLDSVGNAGADDDAAGTVTALAVAQALKDMPLRYNLRIVGFDQEESGLIGSAAYARALQADGTLAGLVGVINLEMTGYDSDNDGGFHVIDCNENSSADLTALVTRVVQRDPLSLRKVDACTNRSDHASFWRYGKPAIVISENFFGGDGNPCYHATCDKVDKINFTYMTNVTTAVARATADLLVAP